MTTNPLINAASAAAYIISVVTLISNAKTLFGEEKETMVIPIFMLSLLTLSVASMAFVFFYQPALLLMDGRGKEAASLFLKTIGIFASFTITAGLILFAQGHFF